MESNPQYRKHYGVADFERYYSGSMSSFEMHELEKAALEDNFLADALEGYGLTKTANIDVDDLKNRLSTRTGQKESKPVLSMLFYNKYFRAAAMLVLLCGAGWLIFRYAGMEQNGPISLERLPEKETTPIITDSVTNTRLKDQQENKDTAINQEAGPAYLKNGENNAVVAKQDQRSRKSIMKKANPESLDASSLPIDSNATKEDLVMSDAIREMPVYRRFQMDTSPLQSTTASVFNNKEQNSKVKIINKGNQVIITMQEDPDGVNSMVLSKKKTDSTYKKLPSIIIEEAEPEDSWSEVGAYLSEKLTNDENNSIAAKNGTIKLSFDIDTSGKPTNIHVDSSLCKECDAEAMRILKEGPKWKKKTKRGKLIIQF